MVTSEGERVTPPPGPGGMPETTALTPEAFASAFESSSRVLWCVAAGVLGSSTHAEDVVQEAALIGLRKIDQFDASTSFVAWMSQIVRYTALNESSRRRRRATAPTDPVVIDASRAAHANDAPAISAAGAILSHQPHFDDAVVNALDDLSETARATLLLRTIMDLSYEEIARVLDIPAGTAMSHVHRARKTLRTQLADRRPASATGRMGSA